MKKDLMSKLAKSLKIALAALLAAALAGGLGLQYATTAGIITILSIQGTKLETFQTAGKRALAFLCALVLAWACFETMGYNLGAFGAFLFFFVLLCLLMGWQEAIAMDSVLVSHFLGQGAFFSLLGNEMLLFAVGTGFGILVNLHLRSRRERFTLASDLVDGQIKEILGDMARCLTQDQIEESSCHGAPSGAESSFDTLREALRRRTAPWLIMATPLFPGIPMNWTMCGCGSNSRWCCRRSMTISGASATCPNKRGRWPGCSGRSDRNITAITMWKDFWSSFGGCWGICRPKPCPGAGRSSRPGRCFFIPSSSWRNCWRLRRVFSKRGSRHIARPGKRTRGRKFFSTEGGESAI